MRVNSHQLFDAIDQIREDYVLEARTPETGRRRRGWLRWGAAACLCGVVLAAAVLMPWKSSGWQDAGLLTITAYAASTEESCPMEEGVELPLDYRWSPAMSSIPGLPLQLSYVGGGEAVFEVSADGGTFLLWTDSQITDAGPSFRAENGTTLYWNSAALRIDAQTGESSVETFAGKRAYVDILIRQEEAVVGYAVVEISREEAGEIPLYAATLLKTELFRGDGGVTPEVTEEEVAREIAQVKETAQER